MSQTTLSIGQFAEQILFSDSLDLKLTTPASVTSEDSHMGAETFQTPVVPTRPKGLELSRPQLGLRSNDKQHFPSRSSLSNERARGLVLHFFANHELLALELMAVALLKWPNAPEGFRQGLVRTMQEEQSHMRLYLQRMHELGVEFGETRLNSFFWDCLKDLKSPAEFAAAMAMTFEQANIDFALHYENIFEQEGDAISAAIMRQVREEEIGHVKHGVVWFERWRPKAESLFKEWQNHLTFPMTPARAKGITFDRDGRFRAGLPPEFIDELATHNQSKGRPPRLFWFNPGCEQEVESKTGNWTPPKALQHLQSDYAPLLGLMAHESDIVMVKSLPSLGHLKSLAAAGFTIPEFVREDDIKALKLRKFWSFEPWGWSPESRKKFSCLQPRLIKPMLEHDRSLPSANESVFSKTLAAKLRQKLQLDSIQTSCCTTIKELTEAIAMLTPKSPTNVVVLKSSFSASGRGMIRVKNQIFEEKQLTWAKSVIERDGHVLAEPWLDKIVDLSAHVDISRDGVVKFIGFTRFWTDARGQYRGHILGRMLDDCGSEILGQWHREDGWRAELQAAALAVGQEIFNEGYYGPMGIDAFIYRDQGELRLRPLVEINPRYSMGRLALAISPRITAKRCGLRIHASASDLKKAGFQTFLELVQKLDVILPTEYSDNGTSKTISQGIFAINDPSQATQSLALLVVAKDLEQGYDCLKSGGLHDPYLELQGKAGR